MYSNSPLYNAHKNTQLPSFLELIFIGLGTLKRTFANNCSRLLTSQSLLAAYQQCQSTDVNITQQIHSIVICGKFKWDALNGMKMEWYGVKTVWGQCR